jgi:hypothetical protein
LKLVALLLAYAGLLSAFSLWRPIDADEGYYASAVGLVAQGKSVYEDFFYPQAPLLPYLYAPAHYAHASLASLRFLSVIFSVLMLTAALLFLNREFSTSPEVIFVVFAVTALNPYLASWNVVVKTYSAANCLIVASLVAMYFALSCRNNLGSFLAGILVSLATGVRLLYAPIAVVMLAWLVLRVVSSKRGGLIACSIGFALGSIPAVALFVKDPDAYVFNNLLYHRLQGDWPTLVERVLHSFGSCFRTAIRRPYLLMVIGLAVLGFRSARAPYARTDFIQFAALVALAFVAGSLYVYPHHDQYFSATLAPVLLPLTATGVAFVHKSRPKLFRWLPLFFLVLCALEVHTEATHMSRGAVWSLKSYRDLSSRVREITEPNDVVLSFWPGYVYESGRRHVAGLENHFALRISPKLGKTRRGAYKLVDRETIVDATRRALPDAIILGAWMREFDRGLEESERQDYLSLVAESYTLNAEVDGVRVFLRR